MPLMGNVSEDTTRLSASRKNPTPPQLTTQNKDKEPVGTGSTELLSKQIKEREVLGPHG